MVLDQEAWPWGLLADRGEGARGPKLGPFLGAEDGSAYSLSTGGSQTALGRSFLGPNLLCAPYFAWADGRSVHGTAEFLLRYANAEFPCILQVF